MDSFINCRLLTTKTCLSVLAILILYITWQLQLLQLHLTIHTPGPLRRPLLSQTLRQSHPTLTTSCYRYNGVTANNTCCTMLSYADPQLMWQCVRATFMHKHPHLRFEANDNSSNSNINSSMQQDRDNDNTQINADKINNNNNDQQNGSKNVDKEMSIINNQQQQNGSNNQQTGYGNETSGSNERTETGGGGGVVVDDAGTVGVHWALTGDSHLRYIMDVLVRRLAQHVPLIYRLTSYTTRQSGGGGSGGLWYDARILLQHLRAHGVRHILEIRHSLDPFSVTWYPDPFLEQLPHLIDDWLTGRHPMPTLLVVDSGMHWMKATQELYPELGLSAISVLYYNQLVKVATALTTLSKHTLIVFKLIDDVQIADRNPNSTNSFNAATIDKYNQIARDTLLGTGVVVWDSTLPLSRAYTLECKAHPRTTPVTYWWKCKDKKHVGYVLENQYADMLLNFACNVHLNLNSYYCT
ncbi:hypothetical protein Pcinc_015733 [Petrolisthes cinctipes]|uniref:Uncharacterized protein n=1 Tax=Petrolisthes cinctipes TaxID=88211 RepID=A0AAE1FSI1_PETCI|nr:hypothetical protein Pcinc_015733 [Petrolisthes cinctipes]